MIYDCEFTYRYIVDLETRKKIPKKLDHQERLDIVYDCEFHLQHKKQKRKMVWMERNVNSIPLARLNFWDHELVDATKDFVLLFLNITELLSFSLTCKNMHDIVSDFWYETLLPNVFGKLIRQRKFETENMTKYNHVSDYYKENPPLNLKRIPFQSQLGGVNVSFVMKI